MLTILAAALTAGAAICWLICLGCPAPANHSQSWKRAKERRHQGSYGDIPAMPALNHAIGDSE